MWCSVMYVCSLFDCWFMLLSAVINDHVDDNVNWPCPTTSVSSPASRCEQAVWANIGSCSHGRVRSMNWPVRGHYGNVVVSPIIGNSLWLSGGCRNESDGGAERSAIVRRSSCRRRRRRKAIFKAPWPCLDVGVSMATRKPLSPCFDGNDLPSARRPGRDQ